MATLPVRINGEWVDGVEAQVNGSWQLIGGVETEPPPEDPDFNDSITHFTFDNSIENWEGESPTHEVETTYAGSGALRGEKTFGAEESRLLFQSPMQTGDTAEPEPTGLTALFICHETLLSAGNQAVVDLLESAGYTVIVRHETEEEDYTGIDVVVAGSISSDTKPYLHPPVGFVSLDSWRHFGMGSIIDWTSTGSDLSILASAVGHPVSAGLAEGTHTVYDVANYVIWETNYAASAQVIASQVGTPSNAIIFVHEAGDEMRSRFATTRHVALGFHRDARPNLSTTGESLLLSAVAWAADSAYISPPEPAPPPEEGEAVSGLFTQTHVNRWVARAANGPFKSRHDFATNSPGDWDNRIVPERNTAASGTRTLLTSFDGSLPGTSERNSARHHAAAALVHVVSRENGSSDTAARDAAASFLLAQAREPATDFQTNGLSRTDFHDTLHTFSCLVQSWALMYDLLKVAGDDPWTVSEDDEVKEFLYHTANWVFDNVESVITKHFSDPDARWNETEIFTIDGAANLGQHWAYADGTLGPEFWTEHRFINNRRTGMVTAVNMVAHVLDFQGYVGSGANRTVQVLIDHTQVCFREWLKYGVFPDGSLPDQERADSGLSGGESYLAYAAQGVSGMAEIANRALVHGDSSLWEYSTTQGTRGSDGAPSGWSGKSMLFAQYALANHAVDVYERYKAGFVGSADNRLDLRVPRVDPTWDGHLDTAKACVSDYYIYDEFLHSILTRTHPNSYWPSSPASSGAYSAYYGPSGIYPGWHFMFVPTILPEEPVEATWLGLHVTDVELAVWRDRAVNGPFKTSGDFSTNSPGDWDRTITYKDAFAAGWSPYTTSELDTDASGMVIGSTSNQSFDSDRTPGKEIMCAAFVALVNQDATLMGDVGSGLLSQIAVADMDFTNRTRWVIGELGDINPGFQVANYVGTIATAYDYLLAYETEQATTVLTAGEHDSVREWLYHAADYFDRECNAGLENYFSTGRYSDPPSYSDPPIGTPDETFHDTVTQHVLSQFQRSHNNRRAEMIHMIVQVGTLLDELGYVPPSASPGTSLTRFREAGRAWVWETCRFVMEADPVTWSDGTRGTGMLNYGFAALGATIGICDMEARLGNPSLYDFSTTDGFEHTADGTKSVRAWVERFQAYVREEMDHYVEPLGDTSNKLTMRLAGLHRVRDAGIAQAVLYYGDATMAATLIRNSGGAPSWPSSPTNPEFGWMGVNNQFPASLFMFCDTGVDPYPEAL